MRFGSFLPDDRLHKKFYRPIVGNQNIDFMIFGQALHDGDIDHTGRLISTAADFANLFFRYIQKHRNTFQPLIQQLSTVDDDERIDPVLKAGGNAWKKALQRASISEFSWHDLRHTWAS